MMDHLFSSSFDELREGALFTSRRRAIVESDVSLFAALTGDRHPQHTDPTWAASSPFGERVAHGLLVLSCAAGLVPFDPERVVALRRVRNAVFKRPVRLGESVCVATLVREKKPINDDTGLVGVELRVLGGDDELAVRAMVEVIWMRDRLIRKETLGGVSGDSEGSCA
jgi:3-hydroxybutyryl-CoA dehydratase